MLVLGGGSDIVRTVRKLIQNRCRTVVLAGRDPERSPRRPRSSKPWARPRGGRGRVDGLDYASHDAFVQRVLFDEHGDFDIVLLAFGVLGNQELAETDGAEARRIIESNFTGSVSVLVPVVGALLCPGPRYGRRALVRGRRARP